MRNLTLHDVRVALRELLDNHSETLTGTHSGAMFLPALSNIRRKLDALDLREDGHDLTTELAHEDARHDGFAAAVWLCTEAYLASPDLTFDDRVVLKMLRSEILPMPNELSAPYADEAAKAAARAASLNDEHRSALRRFPVRGEKTLLDWVESYIDSGQRLRRLLGQRAMAEHCGEVAVSPLEVGRLRGRSVALMMQLRETLKYELHENPERAREMDAVVFRVADRLSGARATSRDGWSDETFLYSDDANRIGVQLPEDVTAPIKLSRPKV